MGDPVRTTEPPRVLVAGVGNVFLGDDGFGPAVARALAGRALPPGATVRDYGVGGIHLAYDVAAGVDLLVLVDTVRRDVAPGTVTLLAVGEEPLPTVAVDAHAMDPVAMLATVETLGGAVPRTLLVGCEPAVLDERMVLSPPVADAVDRAVDAVLDLLAEAAIGTLASAGAAIEEG